MFIKQIRKQVKKIEDVFVEIIEKISCWNTYFGEKKFLKNPSNTIDNVIEIDDKENEEEEERELLSLKKRILAKPIIQLKKKKK